MSLGGFFCFHLLGSCRNQLCRSKVYCRTVGERQGELHDLLDKLMSKAQKLADSSVSLYYFRCASISDDMFTSCLLFLPQIIFHASEDA